MATLTPAQLSTLKAAALADQTAAGYISAGDDTGLQAWFNTTTTYVVWRSNLPTRDIYDKISGESTTWDWTTYIGNTTAAERDAWDAMTGVGNVNPSLQNVRDGWNKIFSGTGTAVVAQRTHLAAISKAFATKAEQILSSGAGTSASPSVRAWEGTISGNDVVNIRNAQ